MNTVLFATTKYYLPQSTGGSESSTHDLCSYMKKNGARCGVLSDLRSNDFLYFRNRAKSKIGGRKFPCDYGQGYPVFRGWGAENGVSEVVANFNPDVAVIQAGKPVLLAKKFLEAKIKTVIYLRDVEFNLHGGIYEKNDKLSFIANSQFTADSFERQFGMSAVVIPPIIFSENYRVDSLREKVVFICPSPLKGVDMAFRLAEANPDVPFLFVESWYIPPDERREYMERASAAGNIQWLAQQSDMKAVYRQAKLVLVPSVWSEAWGRIVTESQLSGIPTLASNRGGLPESVGAGGVTLDLEDDFEVWNSCLRKYWHDSSFYEEMKNRAFVHSRRDEIQPNFLFAKFTSFIDSL